MNIEELRNTKYFKWMLAQVDELEKEMHAFNKEYLELAGTNNPELPLVLRSHLIIEHYIDRYLDIAIPEVERWDELRLSFSMKLDIISNRKTSLYMVAPGIKALNKVRNKYAHDLHYQLTQTDYAPMTEFVRMWRTAGGYAVPTTFEEVLSNFTLTTCGFLNGYITGIARHTPGQGVLGYLEFIGELQKEEPTTK